MIMKTTCAFGHLQVDNVIRCCDEEEMPFRVSWMRWPGRRRRQSARAHARRPRENFTIAGYTARRRVAQPRSGGSTGAIARWWESSVPLTHERADDLHSPFSSALSCASSIARRRSCYISRARACAPSRERCAAERHAHRFLSSGAARREIPIAIRPTSIYLSTQTVLGQNGPPLKTHA